MKLLLGNRLGASLGKTGSGLGATPSGYFGATPITAPGRLRERATRKPRRVSLAGGGPSPFERYMPVGTRPTSGRTRMGGGPLAKPRRPGFNTFRPGITSRGFTGSNLRGI